MRLPITRSISITELEEVPCKITWIGNEWHIIKIDCPDITQKIPDLTISHEWFENKHNQYLFHHTLNTIFMANRITNFNANATDTWCEFAVKLEEGNFVYIPKLPITKNDTDVTILMTLDNNSFPILKLSAKKT